MNPLAVIVIFAVLSAFWGGSFVAIKIAVESLPPWFGAAARLLVAVASLLIIFKVRGQSLFLPKHLRLKVWSIGLLTVGIPFAFLFYGEQRVSAGIAGIMNGTVPLWTTFFLLVLPSSMSDHKKITWKLAAGLLIGFIGIIVIFYPEIRLKAEREEVIGLFCCVGMAASYAIANIANRKNLSSHPTLSIPASTFHQHLSSFVFLLIFAILAGEVPKFSEVPLKAWYAILYLGFFSSAIAFLFYLLLIRRLGSVKASSVTYLVPVMAVIFDYLVLHNLPSMWSVAGILLILSGLLFIRLSRA